jgi:hypothetical protein
MVMAIRENVETVYREEILYFRKMSWGRYGAALGVILCGCLLLLPLHSLTVIQTEPGWSDQPYQTLFWAQFSVWVIQLGVISRGIALGIKAVQHEHSTPTYGLLLLSQVQSRTLFLGKWKAVMRLMGGYIVVLALIKMMILPMTTMATTVPFISDQMRYLSCATRTPENCPGIQIEGMDWFFANLDPGWNSAYFVLAPLAAIVLCFLEAFASTLLGMMVGVMFKRPSIALLAGILIRFALPLSALLLIASRQFGLTNSLFMLQNPSTTFALVDADTAATIRMLVTPRLLWERLSSNWLDLGVAAAFLILLGLGALAAALAAVRKNRLLMPPIPKDAKL